MPATKRKLISVLLLPLLLLLAAPAFAQQRQLRNPDVIVGELIKVIPSLKDYRTPAGFVAPITRIRDRVIGLNEDNEFKQPTVYTTKPVPDPVVQVVAGSGSATASLRNPNLPPSNFGNPNPTPQIASAVTQNFNGLPYTNVAPADPNMCAGPTAVIQTINNSSSSYFKIWDRNGNVLLNQTLIVNLVATPGYTGNGDPVAIYDQMADRYILTEFGHAGAGSGINTLIACVSQTNNPLGAWYIYKFTDNTFFPDYPHWGAMPNAYYCSTNDFNTAGTAYLGSSIYAFNKTKMLAGDATAEAQRLRLSFNSFPVNVIGATPPPANQPGMFMYYSDDDFTADPNDKDSLGIITFAPNFAVPANTVVTFAQSLMTAPFKSNFCGGRNCVPSASGNGYDGLADRIMNRVVYRNFGAYESMVLNYTVDANVGQGSSRAGLRWYELRRQGGGPWSIYQQSTYAPCGTDWRWMGSININSKGQIALGFDLSSPTKYASMYFTGRNASDPLNQMTVQEISIQNGTAYGTFGNRWGDYNEVTNDVVNDSLFWMTSMWGANAGSWATRVAQFRIGDCDVQSSSVGLTQGTTTPVPEGQNIVYTNTVNNTGCVALVNYLMTDTLPTNVTFVSATNGGTYNAGNRVVSWTVNVPAGTSQTYQFTVNINAGAYYAPVTYLNEVVPGPGLPAGWTTTAATGTSQWTYSTASTHSAPGAFFAVDNAAAITDFRITTSTGILLNAPSSKMTFWHNYNTESGWDGGVVEISTNGGTTWVDLGPKMTINGYNNSVGTGNPIAGRPAFSGNSNGWIQTTVDLTSYAGQTALFRWRMTSDDNTAAVGWYVDDINISSVAQVNMRTTLIGGVTCTSQYKDTVTLIGPPAGCTAQTVTSQPSSTTVCTGSSVNFSVTAAGTTPITYQWQESTNGGGTWNNITNGGIYSNATTATLTINPVTVAMNGYQYRVTVNGCAAPINSNAATLNVVALSVGGTVTPANYAFCGSSNSGTFTLSGYTGNIIRWESSIDGGTTWTPIANTTNTQTFANLAQTTLYRAVVQASGCAPANSSNGTVTVTAGATMYIVADPGTTLCQGDPTRLTVMETGGTVPVTVTQSSSNTITTNNGISCGNATTTSINSYWRAYDLSAFPALNQSFTITTVNFGIEIASGGNQNVTVRLYTQTGAPFPGGTRTQIAQQTYSVPNTNAAIYNAVLTTPVTVPANAQIVVEIQTAGAAGTRFFPGSNTAPESGPSYISSAACAINTPVTYASIGFPNCHIIAALSGTTPAPGSVVTGGTFTWTPAAGLSSTTTNPVAASPATTTTYTVSHNNGTGCIRTASITINVNTRPTVTANPTNVTTCGNTVATFTVGGIGTGLTYQWQVSTDGGVTYTNLANGAPYSGVTTATLTINPATVALSGNRYRAVLSGTCPPGTPGTPNISSGAILTVIAQPNVTIAPAGPICGGVAGTNGVAITASGANTYVWSPTTGLYTDATATTAYTGGNAATVYAAPAVNTTYTVTGTNTTTGCTNTATILVNYTPSAPVVNPASATMCLGDAPVPLTITSSLAPTTVTLTNNTPVAIPDNTANGVTSIINVAGVPAGATVSQMTVTLNMPHTYPADMIINLKAPNGQILNLYKHNTNTDNGAASIPTAGFFNAVVSSTGTVVFSTVPSPYQYGITAPTGPFKADALNAPLTNPGYTIMDPTGFASNAANFAALYPPAAPINGAWTLAMADGGPGDIGTLNSWTLSFTYGTPSTGIWSPTTGLYTNAAGTIAYTGTPAQTVYAQPLVSTTYSVTVSTGTCTSAARQVPVTVNNPINITTQPVNQTVCTDKVATFSVSVTGTSPGYQWQESTNGGTTWTNVTNGGVYSGATTSTLTITNPPVSMNGNQYRVIVGGASPCGNVTSAARTLTVNPLPTVVITASPYTSLLPGLTTTLSSTSTPAAATYTWMRNGAVVSGATTGSYVVDIDHLGSYNLKVVDVNGCVNTSNTISISDSLSGRVFIYPNPNGGQFQVRYNPIHNATTPYGLTIRDAGGKLVYTQKYTLGVPYAPMFVDMRTMATGVYWVEVMDIDNNRLAMGRVEILR